MSKAVKNLLTEEYRARYGDVREVCVADVTRVDVDSITRVRAQLRGKCITPQVIKNSLARRAFEATTSDSSGQSPAGPACVVVGGD